MCAIDQTHTEGAHARLYDSLRKMFNVFWLMLLLLFLFCPVSR